MNLPCCWAYSVASKAYMVLGVLDRGRITSPDSLALVRKGSDNSSSLSPGLRSRTLPSLGVSGRNR